MGRQKFREADDLAKVMAWQWQSRDAHAGPTPGPTAPQRLFCGKSLVSSKLLACSWRPSLPVRGEQTTVGFAGLKPLYGEAGKTVLHCGPAFPVTSCVKPPCALVSPGTQGWNLLPLRSILRIQWDQQCKAPKAVSNVVFFHSFKYFTNHLCDLQPPKPPMQERAEPGVVEPATQGSRPG